MSKYCDHKTFMETEYHRVIQVHQNIPGFVYPYPLMNLFSLNKDSLTESDALKLFSHGIINTFQNSLHIMVLI